MRIYDELWRKIKHLRQEILNLKQVKRASTNSKYYIYRVEGDDFHFAWEITYKDGDQPIIAEVFSYYNTSMGSPVGNKQLITSFSQASMQLTVVSTREIENIRGL